MHALQDFQTDRLERRLLLLAGAYLGIYSLALTLSDAARLRSWQVDYRWQHWAGFAIWAALAWLAHQQLSRLLPERDVYIFPVAALLSGWGLLTIWRLSPAFGLRQTIWLVVMGLLVVVGLRASPSASGEKILLYLRRYKYIWLTSGLLLTAATLVFGTNPMGAGPRLWLGCCGFYIQPSEPLKLLLIVYLAAYLADRQVSSNNQSPLLPLLTPTLVMTGLALLLLIFQRDLGTAAIFMGIYAVIVYAGTGNRRILVTSLGVLILASVLGYSLFDVVNQRVDAWINPWVDPSGRSYQIVQSLLAVANGGVFGRGPGLGSPGLVPVAQSDFIFTSISEESGLLGVMALLGLLAIFVNRGIRSAMQSGDTFRRLLATGLVAHLAGQSLLIIAGNLRMLPLTGVTLPFVSYGGSSLLVSFIELLCLLLISSRREEVQVLQPEALKAQTHSSLFLSGSLLMGLLLAGMLAGWWSIVRGPDLLTRTDNPRRAIADRHVKRGAILDQQERPLAESTGVPGEYVRTYPYPALGPIVGYTHPVYGQAGLEAALDANLRGLRGYPELDLWWHALLYGYPPPGLDVRLSLDLELQKKADQLLGGDAGAIVLLNAATGEILAIASSPGFDANILDTAWESLVEDPASPLYDRAGMGLYPAGNTLSAFILAGSKQEIRGQLGSVNLQDCAITPEEPTWGRLIASGCGEPMRSLGEAIHPQDLLTQLEMMGLFRAPAFPIETLSSTRPGEMADPTGYITGGGTETVDILRVSPLQMALLSATLSNQGYLPTPRLVAAYETIHSGWVVASLDSQPRQVFQAQDALDMADTLAVPDFPAWQVVAVGMEQGEQSEDVTGGYSWYLGGTLSEWNGAPLAIAVILEQQDAERVQEIGHSMFQFAINP